MFKNYVKTALRAIKRHKGYSFINIFGLAIGMACCILILVWVQDELSYDQFHANGDDIYRIIKEEYTEGETRWSALTSPPLAHPLKEDFSEIIRSTRFGNWGKRVVQYQDKRFNEDGFEHADPDFFKIFSFDFIDGNPDSAFSDPYSVILTEDTAKKYFGTEDPIGKILTVENIYDVKVTGIIKNIPENSTIQFDFLSPFSLLKEFIGEDNMQNWNFNSFMTFVQLAQNTDEQGVNQAIAGYLDKFVPEEAYKLVLQPYKKIHLSSYVLHDFSGVGDMKYVYIFSALAFFVLIIACINFMNLATARSSRRALEVGIRKVSGAKRTDLVKQFFGEALFLSFISMILAIFLVEILLPSFNRISGKNLGLDFAGNVFLYGGLLAIAVIAGLFSGIYPALFLSSFQPVKVLKGTLRMGSKGGLFRRILVVTQFSLSVFLIIATMVIFKQLNYIRSVDMGYDREHIIHMSMVGDSNQKYETLKQELSKGQNVVAVSASFALPTKNFNSPGSPDWEGRPVDKEVYMNVDFVDFDYFETLGIEIAEGRTFIYLLSSEFAKWVLVANVIAWPVAYLVAHRWLQNFAYRTNIHVGMFLLAAALSLFIALATVGFKALKTATANPAEALRYE